MKNIITTVAALASRMLRTSKSLEEFSEPFMGRLRAMAASHDLLSQSNWTGADMRALAQAAVQGHVRKGSRAIGLHGPDVVLMPNAAATLGMVFYELVTNAIKYGTVDPAGSSTTMARRVERMKCLPSRGLQAGGDARPAHTEDLGQRVVREDRAGEQPRRWVDLQQPTRQPFDDRRATAVRTRCRRDGAAPCRPGGGDGGAGLRRLPPGAAK